MSVTGGMGWDSEAGQLDIGAAAAMASAAVQAAECGTQAQFMLLCGKLDGLSLQMARCIERLECIHSGCEDHGGTDTEDNESSDQVSSSVDRHECIDVLEHPPIAYDDGKVSCSPGVAEEVSGPQQAHQSCPKTKVVVPPLRLHSTWQLQQQQQQQTQQQHHQQQQAPMSAWGSQLTYPSSQAGSSSKDEDSHRLKEAKCLVRTDTMFSMCTIGTQDARARGTRSRSQWCVDMWDFLEYPDSSPYAAFFAHAGPLMWVIGAMFTVLQSGEPVMSEDYKPVVSIMTAAYFESVMDVLCLAEVLLRYYVCPDRWIFVRSLFNRIDFMAALPLVVRAAAGWQITQEVAQGPAGYFLLCVVPLLRLSKAMRYLSYIDLAMTALHRCAEAIPCVLYTLVFITISFSAAIYIIEDRDNIPNLPTAMWLTIVTMTTVGYGDVTPQSATGSVLVAVLVICSVLYMSIPLGLVGNVFTEVWNDRHRILLQKRVRKCVSESGYTANDFLIFFRRYGSKRKGVDISGFMRLLKELNINLDDDYAQKLFDTIDRDGSGLITAQEFVRNTFPGSYNQIFTKGIDQGKQC